MALQREKQLYVKEGNNDNEARYICLLFINSQYCTTGSELSAGAGERLFIYNRY